MAWTGSSGNYCTKMTDNPAFVAFKGRLKGHSDVAILAILKSKNSLKKYRKGFIIQKVFSDNFGVWGGREKYVLPKDLVHISKCLWRGSSSVDI